MMVSNLNPADIYQKARMHFGSIKSSQLRVTAAEKGLAASKANLYPQLSLGYQIGTNWASSYQTISGYKYDTSQTDSIFTGGSLINLPFKVQETSAIPTFAN